MKNTLLMVLLPAALLAAAPPDPKAAEVAAAMVQAMGGEAAWQKAHFVSYGFKVVAGGKTVVDRSHLWDRQTGRYRLEDKTKDGQPKITLFNIGTQKGEVYVSGKKLDDAAAAEHLKGAYSAFINDSYWLSMPWKWSDAGVHLKYMGKQDVAGTTYDLVELTFDHVGLTPGDKYIASVSRKTHLMEHWEYQLQSGQKGSWDWKYTTTGGVKLAADHTSSDGKSINMGKVSVSDVVNESLFTKQ